MKAQEQGAWSSVQAELGNKATGTRPYFHMKAMILLPLP